MVGENSALSYILLLTYFNKRNLYIFFFLILSEDVKTKIHVVDSEGTGEIKKTLCLKSEEKKSLSVDCMISVSPKQVRFSQNN